MCPGLKSDPSEPAQLSPPPPSRNLLDSLKGMSQDFLIYPSTLYPASYHPPSWIMSISNSQILNNLWPRTVSNLCTLYFSQCLEHRAGNRCLRICIKSKNCYYKGKPALVVPWILSLPCTSMLNPLPGNKATRTARHFSCLCSSRRPNLFLPHLVLRKLVRYARFKPQLHLPHQHFNYSSSYSAFKVKRWQSNISGSF